MSVFDSTTCEVTYSDIEGFPGYRVGDDGTVWSRWWFRKLSGGGRGAESFLGDTWRRLKPAPNRSGYRHVNLSREGKKYTIDVHRLVLTAFRGLCPDGMEGCHENGVRGDNWLGNLRWGTKQSNAADRVKHGTHIGGDQCHLSKMTSAVVLQIRNLHASGWTPRQLTEKFGGTQSNICYIVRRKTWRYI